MEVKRGDIVIAVLPGDYGKGRPAVLIQSDAFNATHASLVVCPITSHAVDAPLFRIPLPASTETGLETPSQVMVDKMTAIRRDRITRIIGRIDPARMNEVNRAVALWLSPE